MKTTSDSDKKPFSTGPEFALQADLQDPMNVFRERFFFPDPRLIYLDGNSLGPLLKKTGDTIEEFTRAQWGEKLIESWNDHWVDLPEKVGNRIARLVGASDGEVVVADSTSVNLYKLAHGALKLRRGRNRVVSDTMNFPTDLYILQGILKEAGPQYELVLAGTKEGIHPDLEELEALITEDTALVVLSAVAFKSGYFYDMAAITEMAHRKGAFILWDLSHATGAVPVGLRAANADMAVGCTYKYLNGGPGSPAFLYVRKDLQPLLQSPIQGWFGEENPFRFDLDYTPAGSSRKYLAGTPPILSLAAIGPGVEILLEAGMENLRHKSLLQGEYLLFLAREFLFPLGFSSGSPEDPERRGSHIALRHPEAYRICQAMIHGRIIPDFRDPDIIRLGITPLYTTWTGLHKTVMRIREILTSGEHLRISGEKKKVT
ncbi:MAG: kynureninase [Bacteroidales bacterium]|nr:kynureninase [Bacteroidales bacterium]